MASGCYSVKEWIGALTRGAIRQLEDEPHQGDNRRDGSSITGHFVKPDTSRRHPDTTVTENG
ncbi:hypothetical protein [Nocardia arthritidis]|uniref:hypothetical protein n=1 Tax=Nocardia arthritidis TaxID=228602 RepID=UPI0007A53253|nr:hypothetical protein [Nocardia arthritidis]